jgi:hypothetical protein
MFDLPIGVDRENSHQTTSRQSNNSQQVPRSNRGRSNVSYPGFKTSANPTVRNFSASRRVQPIWKTVPLTHFSDSVLRSGRESRSRRAQSSSRICRIVAPARLSSPIFNEIRSSGYTPTSTATDSRYRTSLGYWSPSVRSVNQESAALYGSVRTAFVLRV